MDYSVYTAGYDKISESVKESLGIRGSHESPLRVEESLRQNMSMSDTGYQVVMYGTRGVDYGVNGIREINTNISAWIWLATCAMKMCYGSALQPISSAYRECNSIIIALPDRQRYSITYAFNTITRYFCHFLPMMDRNDIMHGSQ